MANVLEILNGFGSAFRSPNYAIDERGAMSAAPALPSMFGQDPMTEQAAQQRTMDLGTQTMQAAPLPPQAVQAPPMQEPAKKPRMSIIDLIGQVGNALSVGGGGEARYRTEAERARDEQVRMAQEQDAELQRRMNQQKFEAGNIELAGNQNVILGQSMKGLRAVYDKNPAAIGRAWEFVSSQLGIPAQRRAEIAQALATDPEGTLAVLEGAMAQEQKGSKPKEVAIYELLRQNKPDVADAYLKSLTEGKPMTPYQQAQARLAERRFAFDQYKYQNPIPRPTAAGKEGGAPSNEAITSAKGVLDRLETSFTQLKNAGGISASGMTPGQRAGVVAYDTVPFLERVTNGPGYSARQDIDGLLTQGVFSLIPLLTGAKLGGKSFDAKSEMDNLKTSLASAKDYDSAMRSITAFREKINRLEFGPSAPARPQGTLTAPPRKNPPASRGPQPGKVEGGYRFKGGNPADQRNWVKVS